MDTLLTYLLPIGKFTTATFLLMAFYWYAWRKRATYRSIRLYLLFLPLAALLMTTVSIPVYTPPAKVVYLTAPQADAATPAVLPANAPQASPAARAKTDTESAASPSLLQVEEQTGFRFSALGTEQILLALYIAVALCLLLYRLIGIARIKRLESGAEKEAYEGISVCSSDKINTPFSFYRRIYLPRTTLPAQKQIILTHEMGHIRFRHYRDVWFIELLSCLLWFNPLIWWIRTELRNVHEFQADAYVLQGGQKLAAYQSTLLQDLLGSRLTLANGFNRNLIRRRFLNMREDKTRHLSASSKIGTGTFLAALCALFCFTTGQADTIYRYAAAPKPAPVEKPQAPAKEAPEAEAIAPAEPGKIGTTIPEQQPEKQQSLRIEPAKETAATNLSPATPAEPKSISAEPGIILSPKAEGSAPMAVAPTNFVKVENKHVPLPKKEETKKESFKTFTLAPEKLRDEKDYDYKKESTYSRWTGFQTVSPSAMSSRSDKYRRFAIRREKDATYFAVVYQMHWDAHWVQFGNRELLVDCETKDKYVIRDIEHVPLNKYFFVCDQLGQYVVFVLRFPPLDPSVDIIDFTCDRPLLRDRTNTTNGIELEIAELEERWIDFFGRKEIR